VKALHMSLLADCMPCLFAFALLACLLFFEKQIINRLLVWCAFLNTVTNSDVSEDQNGAKNQNIRSFYLANNNKILPLVSIKMS
jgi:hypothetical protein